MSLPAFLDASPSALLGELERGYTRDGFATLYSQQTKAWDALLPLLQAQLRSCLPNGGTWSVLLEFPLYRLRKRIDAVILTGDWIIVLEVKLGATAFLSPDLRQVEDYALDLRDFHAASRDRPLLPVLWCPDAATLPAQHIPTPEQVPPVQLVGGQGLAGLLTQLSSVETSPPLNATHWDTAPYSPVPNIIEAATAIFAGHDVRDIARAEAANLGEATARLVELIAAARNHRRRVLLFLTGVPGSGKTLAGLKVVHDALASGGAGAGDIVYLSGNTPLVTVLREALAQDEHQRGRGGAFRRRLEEIRREVRTRIQHITDFLRDNLTAAAPQPPHEHAIVFDEAQRAWDAQQGRDRFGRDASEPSLLLEIMSRHPDWCACVCLVGGGQEINTGEQGVRGWGEALRQLPAAEAAKWQIHAPPDVLRGGTSTAGLALGEVPGVTVHEDGALQLLVPMRSYRSQHMSEWVARVLEGAQSEAAEIAKSLGSYPIMLTRSLHEARTWLRLHARGTRTFGLVASSEARRLRADGLGQFLAASDGNEIAHWYLRPLGDIRASSALEVPANEYTCQGLELDFVGLCWGGDFVWTAGAWRHRQLAGCRWRNIRDESAQRLLRNSYRVLLTRAREGMILFVPPGDCDDLTRAPAELDSTAAYLQRCGVQLLVDQQSR